MRRAVGGVVGGVVVLLLAACAGEPSDPVTVTVTEEAEEESPSAEPDETTAEETPVDASGTGASVDTEQTFEMPAVVGQNLQDAQDLLQTLDSYLMDQVDATGLERFAINDSNWTVCAQDPAPGTVVPISTVVTLSAVKLDEACP